LGGISAAETDGVRRNQAWRRCGDAVARWVAREERNEWARGKKEAAGRNRPSHWSGSISWLGTDRWAWPDKWARDGREREVRGRCF
jgi:hypothetical protein